MRFLLDVHIASSVGKALAEQGHDVLRASDAHADWSDRQLLQLAVQQGRFLITEDRDFSDLIYRDAADAPNAILYLRCEPMEQREIVERLLLVLANSTIEGHMVVLRRSNVRFRPLPEKSSLYA